MDYIGRALVAEALREWREQLQASASVSALRDLSYSEARLIDLGGAHPGGLAPFFAGRPTLLSSLIREDKARAAAEHRAELIREAADEVRAATGAWTAALVVGTAAWSEGGHTREMPLVMRPVLWDAAREADAFVTMLDEVSLNPVFVAELRARGDSEPVTSLVPESAGGTSFDPRPVWDAIREFGPLFGDDFHVRERLLLGAFDDPETRLVGDLDDLGDALQKSDVVAAVAGDHEAITRLSVPIPAFPTGDRDPFAERGIGDLDDGQFAALDAVATGRSLFIQSGPGFDSTGMVAAIAADGAASGKCVMVVAGNASLLRAVNARLDALGAGDVAVDGSQDATARSRLLASITMGDVEVDDGQIRVAGERLLAARREAQARFDGLHRIHRPWDVSAFDAVQAIVRLTSTDPTPETEVRLGADAAAIVAEHGFASVARALVDRMGEPDEEEVEAEPVTTPTVSLVPWWSSLTENPAEGAALDEALATLLVRHIPKMRSEAALAAHETGVDEATSLAHWSDQVQLFTDLRATLEIFSPAVFHRSLHDIVAATAPPGNREGSLARRDRRALVRRAVELLRPGRGKATLHRDLVAAHDQALRWRGMASAGGWPVVPDDFDIFADRMDQVERLWARLGEPVARVTGRQDVPELSWDDMTRVLSELAEGIPGTLEAARSRPLERAIEDVGLGELLADARSRDASPEQVRRDLEFAWWGSAFEGIVAADPRLTAPGALGRAVSAFLAADEEFGRLRVGPLMRAVAERRRSAIVRNPDAARDVFAALMEGATAPYRDLWRDAGAIVASLRPVVLATAEQVSRIAPPMRVVDTVVITGAESLALAETIPALARARQVVVVGDAETATRSAVSVLATLLPRVTMALSPQPRDPRVSTVLAAMSYGRVLQALPSAGSASRLDVTVLDAVGAPAAGHGDVESTRAEVMVVLERADRAWRTVPRRSLAVVAGNDVHADRIRDALAERDPALAEAVAVVPVGEAAGIEVDEIVLSLGYARDARGALPHRLGALGSELGRQALAQALVASRERLAIVTSLDASHLSAVADGAVDPEGIDALRDLVVRGDAAPVAPERSEPAPSDWLLSDIATRLRAEGYGVRLRYGVGADAIPMVVGGPHDRGYRVAVVTDEAHTGAAVSVRDRLRWQQSRLEALGWIVLPLWTLDVFTDPDGALDAVRTALDADIAAETAALPTISIPVAKSSERQPDLFIDLEDQDTAPDGDAGDGETDSTPKAKSKVKAKPKGKAKAKPKGKSTAEPEPEPDAGPESDAEPKAEPAPKAEPEPDAEPEPTRPRTPTMGFGVPKLAHPRTPHPRPAKGTDRPLIPTRAWEDEEDGWGGRPQQSSRDDELRRDKPPHW